MELLALLLVLLPCVLSIPIQNGLIGEPEISCGPESITISFNTQNTWEGKLYVKNRFEDGPPCVENSDGRSSGATIELNFQDCGVLRERSIEPRGVYVSVTVIMSFHRTFLTKIDRALRARCFYMEADKTVSQELEVSMLTTALATFNVPMPVCKYEIRNGPNLEDDPVAFATVGQEVWHHWVCESDYENTFCSYPYDCKVDDGNGNTVELLDLDGCGVDKFLLGNVEYPEDLWARKEAHVFKYADKPNLYFNCQMRVTIKDPNTDCPRPQCTPLRAKRSAQQLDTAGAAITDVSSRPIMVADIDLNDSDLPANLFHPHHYRHQRPGIESLSPSVSSEGQLCLSAGGLGLVVALAATLLVCTVAMMVVLMSRRTKQ